MRSCVTSLLCSLLICGLAVSAAQAGEKVDNPEYKHWAQFKPGAFSELKTEGNAMGMKTKTTMTRTLKEITPERAVVEITVATLAGGQKMDMPPQKQQIPAKIEAEDARKIEDPKKGDKTEAGEILDVKKGEEEVKVGDKKIKCKWVETKIKQDDQTITSKSWTCEDVPGQIVKTAMTMEGKMKMSSEGSLVKYSAEGSGKADKADKGAKAEPSKAGSEKDKAEKKDAGDQKAPADDKAKTDKKEQKEKK
jgi:hypothetical protein